MLVQLDHDNSGGRLGQNYYNFTYQATRNPAGEVDGILVFAYEVTAQVRARQQVEQLNEELEARVAEHTREVQSAQAEAERQRLRLQRLFMQAPAAICILDGLTWYTSWSTQATSNCFPAANCWAGPSRRPCRK
ncbi:hypothetical protein ACFS7Z_14780 [Pontibacter toksunensis]|uniref:PAC domain-containing protein n=1 Tax=Pontibacter toksunensis TaxID=1332631 RepID=A0ABW6BV36_9BACT